MDTALITFMVYVQVSFSPVRDFDIAFAPSSLRRISNPPPPKEARIYHSESKQENTKKNERRNSTGGDVGGDQVTSLQIYRRRRGNETPKFKSLASCCWTKAKRALECCARRWTTIGGLSCSGDRVPVDQGIDLTWHVCSRCLIFT
jgi:hypothetical protein